MKPIGDRETVANLRSRIEFLIAQRNAMREERDAAQEKASEVPWLRSEVESLTAQRDALKQQNRRLGFSEDLWRERVIDAGGSVERDYEAEDAAYEAGR